MPLLIVDGPEAAGKTTLIRELVKAWNGEVKQRQWGPVISWTTYVKPLETDVEAAKDPTKLIIWDRSWASEWAYDILLSRGRGTRLTKLAKLEGKVDQVHGSKIMVTAPPIVLRERRAKRTLDGGKPDLPVHPAHESRLFGVYADMNGWMLLDTTHISAHTILNEVELKFEQS